VWALKYYCQQFALSLKNIVSKKAMLVSFESTTYNKILVLTDFIMLFIGFSFFLRNDINILLNQLVFDKLNCFSLNVI